jgi:hypothetical protein
MTQSNVNTAAQIKEHNIAKMGNELGELYSVLWQQLNWLHRKWGDYVALFGTTPDRLKILNSAASDFFGTVQTSLWEDALLHLARITDSPKSAGKPNLTFRRLPELIERNDTRMSVEALLENSLDLTDFARDWRNRRIAHRDLSLALERPTEPLKAASRSSVNEALAALGKVLNCISLAYLDSTTMFEFAQEPTAGGSLSMLHYLRAGLTAEEARRQRIRSGTSSPEDFKRENI